MGLRHMENIKFPIQLVFSSVFFVAPIDTYFNMLPLARLEDELKSCTLFVYFNISMCLIKPENDWNGWDSYDRET
jgi:hypothetical protein